jgi:hypothetical protein
MHPGSHAASNPVAPAERDLDGSLPERGGRVDDVLVVASGSAQRTLHIRSVIMLTG